MAIMHITSTVNNPIVTQLPNGATVDSTLVITIPGVNPESLNPLFSLTPTGGATTNPVPGFGVGVTPLDLDLQQMSIGRNNYGCVIVNLTDPAATFMQPNDQSQPTYGYAIAGEDPQVMNWLFCPANGTWQNPTTAKFYCQWTGGDKPNLRSYNIGIVAQCGAFIVPFYIDPKIKNWG